ncbi:MAG: hypothetical protein ABIO24_07850, partial [Saprospiraceae bacterium]
MGIFTFKQYFIGLGFLLGWVAGFGQGPVVTVSSNAPLCAGAANLQLNETGGQAVIWNWSGPNGYSSTVQHPVIPNPGTLNSGLYSVTITDAFGAMNVASLNVAINPFPTVNAIPNQSLCTGSLTTPINFTGNVPGTQYSWTNNNDTIGLALAGTGNIGAFPAQNAKTVPITALVTVMPQYTANGLTCTGAAKTLSYTVQPAVVANAGPDIAICAGGNTTLSGSGGLSCSWQPATGLDNASTCNPVASPSQSTVYTLTVTTAAGCTGTDAMAVNIHVPKPLVCNNLVLLSLDQTGQALITANTILQGGTLDNDVFTVKITTITGLPVENPVGC